jgi:DNA-binding transcriptional LysR family regulator
MADPTYLRTFLAIYRHTSVTKAAKALRMTQPAISQHLKALEAQLERTLFVRHSRGVEPTPASHELARVVGPHIDALDAALESMRTGTKITAGVVHLGGPIDLLATRVIPALAPLADKGVRLVVHPGLVAALVAALAAGEIDLLVAADRILHPGVVYEPLFKEKLALVGTRARADALPPKSDPEARHAALAKGPFVAFAHAMPLIRHFFRSG